MKISVVVPVFKYEKYVKVCIDSIINQNYSDWELILVNDGSSDGSAQILDNYAKSDNRISVIHKKNEGPGKARNQGIEKANGEYIVFVDSDDMIAPDYLYLLSKEIADVVFIDVDLVDENQKVLKNEYLSSYRDYSRDDIIRYQMTGKMPWGGVRKAVRRELLLSNGIKYSEIEIGEEAVYSFKVLYYAKSYSFISKPLYKYVYRIGSQSNRKEIDPWGDVSKEVKQKIVEMGLYEKYADTINAFFATATIISLYRMASNYSIKQYNVFARKRIDEYKNLRDEKYAVDTDHMSTKAKIIYPFIKYGMIEPIYILSYFKK